MYDRTPVDFFHLALVQLLLCLTTRVAQEFAVVLGMGRQYADIRSCDLQQGCQRSTSAGESHPRIADEWGSVHFIEVDAMNENMARAKLARDYPESDGFVIDEINPT